MHQARQMFFATTVSMDERDKTAVDEKGKGRYVVAIEMQKSR